MGHAADVASAVYTKHIGAPERMAARTEPEFDPDLNAFYGTLIVEIPTPLWSTIDAAARVIEIPPGLAAANQERASSSPIGYTPPLVQLGG